MKKLVLFLITLAYVGVQNGIGQNQTDAESAKATVPIWQGTLIEATEKAAREKKGLLIILWEDQNDSLVQHYLQNVLTDEAVIQAFSNTIVTISDSVTSEMGVKLIELFGFGNFPVIQFYNVQGEDLYEFDTFIEPDQMIDILKRNVLNGSLR